MQRPQHLLERAAKTRRVFFWEEPIWHQADEVLEAESRLEILREGPSLWVVRPHLRLGMDADVAQRSLLDQLRADYTISTFLRWYYTPMALRFSRELHAVATVYDCMDELSGFLNAPSELGLLERELFTAADVVFTGGHSLYAAKRRQHPNVHAFPSSIDVAHFAQAMPASADLPSVPRAEEPADQQSIPHPRAGFYGVIDERLDLALLAEVAALRPNVHLVLLGPVVKIDRSLLPQAPNLHYLDAKSYAELPAYLAGWDVALLPFARNEATRFISPTKTPEYLAAGRPVVSTAIEDVVADYGKAGLVAIAATAAEFAAAIDAALKPQTQQWREAVKLRLSHSSWDTTWQAMEQEINKVAASRTRSTATQTSLPVALHLEELRSGLLSNSAARLHPQANTAAKFRPTRLERFDYLVVGAGFAGAVLAERIAQQLDKRVLVVDRRPHIAGNAFDRLDANGILVHKYGPHIFHTNSDKVVAYLSQFTEWRPYEHRVLASVDQQLLPIPINLDTINRLYKLNLDADGMRSFLATKAIASPEIRTSEEVVLSRVGRELYEKFFRNYTRKQWGLDPSELDAAVAGRIPVRFDHDDRYFSDTFQAMPRHGYTRMFERMLDHPNITVRTGVDYREAERSYPDAKVVYTGPIDEYFGLCYGPLPYRSLTFKHETHDCEIYQSAPVINYPNDHAYTRVTEFKYLTGQKHAKTSLVYEYPTSTGDPYYPIPRPENAQLYARYQELAAHRENVTFSGRLANYKYLNMDQVVAQSLMIFDRMAKAQQALATFPSLSKVPILPAPLGTAE